MSVSKYYLLDTFSNEPFKGNPTPVCILNEMLSAGVMAKLAREFNSPVTTFVEPKNKDGSFNIRYFTVEGEIPACGHATLGAAFLLLHHPPLEEVEFVTIEKVRIKACVHDEMVYLQYPIYERKNYEIPPELLHALTIKLPETHFYCDELKSLFIELKGPDDVRRIKPDFGRLRKASDELKEVVVMSSSNSSEYDLVLRSFCPWIGIDEDPVTGSIHSVLAPFWQERTGKNELTVFQASERSGELFVKITGDSVKIGGNSRIVVEGQLNSL
ncbi:MAG: PhzF family phenazine biosynthesis protein [Marinoscillum sp.]|uniref:PhzF family phenazine biosynthesis protein n=1 Tax=Marinoscillum sp. TaxID=2024838 RepID=UPI0033053C5B